MSTKSDRASSERPPVHSTRFALFAEHDFRSLWLGQTASLLGDWLLRIALPLYVYTRTGSALSTSVAFVAEVLPGLLLAPIAGTFVDRWDPRRTMIAADLSRAAVLLPLLSLPGKGAIWSVYVVAMVQASLSQLFAPARNALLPELIATEQTTRANSALAIAGELALLFGPALGGLLYDLVGLRLSVGIDVASYLFSALSLITLHWRRSVPSHPTAKVAVRRGRSIVAEISSGIAFVKKNASLRALLVMSLPLFVGGGMLTVLVIPLLRSRLHANGLQFGLVVSAQSFGGLFGAGLATRVTLLLRSTRLTMAITTVLIGGAVLVLAIVGQWWWAALALGIGGAPTVINAIAANGILQREATANYRGRVTGLYGALVALGNLIGAPLAGLLVTHTDIVVIIDVAAALLVGSGLLAVSLFPAQNRNGAEGSDPATAMRVITERGCYRS